MTRRFALLCLTLSGLGVALGLRLDRMDREHKR